MEGQRRDSKRRILRRGESIRANGKYQFKYHVDGKPHFVYSWRLVPTDPLPVGKKPCLSLRELEKQIGYDLENRLDPTGKNMTVRELVDRYIATKTGVKKTTEAGMNPKTLQYLMGHSEIGVTLNTYTHLGLNNAVKEMERVQKAEDARKEVEGPKKENQCDGLCSGRYRFRVMDHWSVKFFKNNLIMTVQHSAQAEIPVWAF